jgi:hypothetical protein
MKPKPELCFVLIAVLKNMQVNEHGVRFLRTGDDTAGII